MNSIAGFAWRAVVTLLLTACTLPATAQSATDTEIAAAKSWAFPSNPAPSIAPAAPDDKILLHLPGSTQAFTQAQIRNLFVAPDWWPHDHPPMPQIVARGREPTWACAYCHLPGGQGWPENASLAGLPADYIVEQVRALRSGARTSGNPEMAKFMPVEARNVSDADLRLSAEYFSQLRFKPWTQIVESANVPKTRFAHFMLVPIKGAGSEPIGHRIIEIAQNLERTERRDERSGFITYVPPGSIARGKRLATALGSKTQACVACHGADLRGVGNIPPLAGGSPTYLVRQLIQFQDGSRSGPAAAPMQQVAATLTVDEMIAAAAYAASRKP